MKKTIIALAILLASATQATVISPNTIIGFTDSSFNYDSQKQAQAAEFCFIGNVNDVCAEIIEGVNNRNMMYFQGAHDKMELILCKVNYGDSHTSQTDSVEVNYSMSDDYGSDYLVSRKISECSKSDIVK